MAPSTVISLTSLRSHSSGSGNTMVNVAETNSLNPLGASFGGPVVTASHEDTTVGPLLLDPTGSSSTAATDVPTTVTQTFSLFPLIPSTPSSKPVAPSSVPATGQEPSISQATLIGVTVAISVIAFIALSLLYYLWWRKRRPTEPQPPATKEKERRRVTWTLRGIISERDARDPFADVHQPLPTLPRETEGSQRGSSKIIHCATDAGSVYVLDGESIYGDNGASVKGVLPPPYDELPRKTLHRDLPPLPPMDGSDSMSPSRQDFGPDGQA